MFTTDSSSSHRPFRQPARMLYCSALLLLSSSCALHSPRGAKIGPLLPEVQPKTAVTEEQNSVSVERGSEYTLAFVEFDSSGSLVRRAQLDRIIEEIETFPEKDGKALVVVFVHGWGHSAAVNDSHVIAFRGALDGLAKMPDLAGRRVIGVYVGWPARWLKDKVHLLTFLDRTLVADRVASSCGTREAFREMQQAVEARRTTEESILTVAVGHSLGGKFLFVPMEALLDHESKSCEDGRLEPYPKTLKELVLFGDHVLLINPAQDVHDYEVFQDFALKPKLRDQARVLSIFSSEGDGVMQRAYRIGRTIRNLFGPQYWNAHFYSETVGLGWKSEQVTHDLCLSEPSADKRSVCARNENAGCTQKYGSAELRARTSDPSPFALIRVDGRIIKKHGEIFDKTFRDFLVAYVADKDKASCKDADPSDLATIR